MIANIKCADMFTAGVAISLVWVFPMQVFAMAPWPALIPYAFLFVLLMLRTSFCMRWPKALFYPKDIGVFVFLFLVFVVFHVAWQLWFGFISVSDSISAIVNFVAPASFFYFFRFLGSSRDFYIFLTFFVLSTILVSVYWVFDSYSMWFSGSVLEYSRLALEYSAIRNPDAEMNAARIEPFHRAYGLLESHSITAGCVAFMCFAVLATLDKNRYMTRTFVILASFAVLIIGQNTTGLVAFAITVLLVEFEFIRLSFYGRVRKETLLNFTTFVLLAVLFSVLFFQLVIKDSTVLLSIAKMVTSQIKNQLDLVSGDIVLERNNQAYLTDLLIGLRDFFFDNEFAIEILTGQGFSTHGWSRGGDFGVLETLAQFGLLFSALVLVSFVFVIHRNLRMLNTLRHERRFRLVVFALSIVLYLVLTEIHYSVWSSKILLPMLFVALSVLDRCGPGSKP